MEQSWQLVAVQLDMDINTMHPTLPPHASDFQEIFFLYSFYSV